MRSVGLLLVSGFVWATVGCSQPLQSSTDGGGATIVDASHVAEVGDAREAGGDGASSPCLCASDLSLDVVGDGEPLHLTSSDVRASLPYASFSQVAAQCLPTAVPWSEWATGEINDDYFSSACAGPGGAPPCILLNGNAVASGSLASSYVDRAGTMFRGDATVTATCPDALMGTVIGQYTLHLEDGRTLSGGFQVCLLAITMWP